MEETSSLNTKNIDPKDDECNPNKKTNTVLKKGEECGSGRNYSPQIKNRHL